MVWCVAVGCTNYKSKNKELTFFCLPKDKKLAEAGELAKACILV